LRAARSESIPVDPDLVLHGDFFPEGGRIGAAQLLSLPEPPTAIFAGSDLQALGVYEEARRRGLRIPDDLSVVGFDDLSIAQYVTPPLTTVRQPHSEMAAEAVRMVLAMKSADRPNQPTRIELATSLVVRQSTAPIEANS
jgi:DNA-binding LacI/PurR family transcriptional regulator